MSEFWEDFSVLEETEVEEDEEDETQVRARQSLRPSGDLPPAAPVPHFTPHSDELKDPRTPPRIVVDLSSDGGPTEAERPQPPAKRPAESPDRQQGAGPEAPYSYREDLKDLIGSGWRRRGFYLSLVLLLLASVAAIYYEVHRYVRPDVVTTGTVTAQQLNLRDQPSLDASEQIGTLPYGTKVRVISHDNGNRWLEVQVIQWGGPVENEQVDRGWVSSRFVALDGPLRD